MIRKILLTASLLILSSNAYANCDYSDAVLIDNENNKIYAECLKIKNNKYHVFTSNAKGEIMESVYSKNEISDFITIEDIEAEMKVKSMYISPLI